MFRRKGPLLDPQVNAVIARLQAAPRWPANRRSVRNAGLERDPHAYVEGSSSRPSRRQRLDHRPKRVALQRLSLLE